MSLTWTLSSGGKHEVSSEAHLLQVMNQGSLYADAGSPPADYWGSSYVQTQNIDLANHHADIVPIGSTTTTPFSGDYDGARYKISNWTYTAEVDYKGLFGYAIGGKISRVRLSGVWVTTHTEYTGFLCGRTGASTSIYDIEGDFSPGTSITELNPTAQRPVAPLVGGLYTSDAYGLTVKGTVDVVITSPANTGGVIGDSVGSTVTMVRNLATFPTVLYGIHAGGIIGRTVDSTVTQVMNAMFGDISGNIAGGIIGGSQSNDTVDRAVNSMTGDVFAPSNLICGGIVGRALPSSGDVFTGTRLLNYMTGDALLESGAGSSISSGGIIGNVNRSSTQTTADASISLSVSAMNGSVTDSIVGTLGFTPTLVEAYRVTHFGMTSSTNTNTSVPPSDGLLLDHPDLATLGAGLELVPYFEMTGTDPDGTVYDWDFVYGNVGGRSTYQLYTHLVLHKSDIVHPLLVDLDIPESSTTVYATLVNYTNDVVANQNSLTIVSIGVPPPLTVDARSINISTSIGGVDGAVGYRVTYEGPTGGEIISVSDLTELNHNITDVAPETVYTVRLYANTGGGYALVEGITVTTLPNVATSYDINDFVKDGVFQLASLSESTLTNLSTIMDELLTTGDVVSAVRTRPDLKTSFINLGGTLSIKELDGVFLPFEEASGTGQDVNVTLSDDSTNVTLAYNEAAHSITVNSVEYFVGDSFILDGRKITVVDV